MELFISILFLLLLKGVKSSEETSVDCYSELVDEDSLQYRVWCDSQKTHKCCKIQEISWPKKVKEYNLTKFEFQEDSNETNPLETCEIFITVKGKNENA